MLWLDLRYGKQIWLLRKFFREKQIPLDLLARVTRFADAVVQPKQSQFNQGIFCETHLEWMV
eukprot:562990-Amphidinium_carterae.1